MDLDLPPHLIADRERLREQYKADLPRFARECLKIGDRDDPYGAAIIPFTFNACQMALDDLIKQVGDFNLRRSEKLAESNPKAVVSRLPIQLVVLKARKVGVSTYLEARAFWRCEFNPGYNALIMAHERDAAQNIADISQRFDAFWDPNQPPFARQRIVRVSDDLIEWEPQHDSRIIVQTAGTKGGGSARGYTFHFEHLSEEAHYPEGSPQLAAAKRARAKFAEVYSESTANGEGNTFHEGWQRGLYLEDAVKMFEAGEPFPKWWNGSFRFFWPWWADEGNQTILLPEEKVRVLETMDEKETDLHERFDLTPEQLVWRRKQIADDCSKQSQMPPEVYFMQEDPSDPDEAFVSSSANVFDTKKLQEMYVAQLNGPPPEFIGYLRPDDTEPEGFKMIAGGRFAKEEDQYEIEGGTFVMWRKPEIGHGYLMGVDTADGLPDGDWTVITIGDYSDGRRVEEVARFRTKMPAREAAYIAFYLGHLYNEAYCVPERNPPGNSFCEKMIDLGYTNMYHDRPIELVSDHESPESFTAGFRTTHISKAMIVHRGEEAVREGLIVLRHPEAIKEWKRYQKKEDGSEKYGAPSGAGNHDDCVMADLLMLFGLTEAPPVWTGMIQPATTKPMTSEEQQNAYWTMCVERVKERSRKKNREALERAMWRSKDHKRNPFN